MIRTIKQKAKDLLPQSRPFRMLYSAAKIIALASIVILVLQEFLLFHPNHNPQSWAHLTSREEFEAVEFRSGRHTRSGMLRRSPARDESPLILFFYGNAMNAAGTMHAMDRFRVWPYFLDFHVLVVDYAGHGPSRGRPSARNIYADALAAFDFAEGLSGVSKVILGAFSLGTGPAIYAAAHRDAAGLFLLSPFANVYDLFNNVLPIFHGPGRLLVRHKFYSDRHAPAVSIPALLVAAVDDAVVPFASSERLNQRFGGPTTFVALPNVGHSGIMFNRTSLESIRAYLESILPGYEQGRP